MKTVYVGWDPREADAYHVCAFSIQRHCPDANIIALRQQDLRKQKLFYRAARQTRDGAMLDELDEKPFSTEFSFTRFLVPHVHKTGWALFCDSDFLFEEDIEGVFAHADDKYAVMCVKHGELNESGEKMDGVVQSRYRRKNWSSLVLWNCDHPANQKLSLQDVNERSGSWLHAFEWLADEEIGDLPPEWNYLAGVSKPIANPSAIHFTLGLPALFPEMYDVEMPCEEKWLATFARMHFEQRRIARA